MITNQMLLRMDNPLAEKMLAQRQTIRDELAKRMHFEAELERSEQTVRNLQYELDVAHREIARLKSL